MIINLINFCGNVCEVLILLYFAKGKFEKRFPKNIFIVLCIGCLLFQFLNNCLFLQKSPLIIAGSVIFTYLFLLLYKMNRKMRLLYSLFIYVAQGLAELMLGLCISFVLNDNIIVAITEPFLYGSMTFISKFISYIFVIIIKNTLFRITGEKINKQNAILFILPSISTLLLIVILLLSYEIAMQLFYGIVLLLTVVLTVSNILFVEMFEKKNELHKTREKLLKLEKNLDTQKVHYEELYKYQT